MNYQNCCNKGDSMKKIFLSFFIFVFLLASFSVFSQEKTGKTILLFKFKNASEYRNAEDKVHEKMEEYFTKNNFKIIKSDYLKIFIENARKKIRNEALTPDEEEVLLQKFYRLFKVDYLVTGTILEYETFKKFKGSFFLNPLNVGRILYSKVSLDFLIVDPLSGDVLFQNQNVIQNKNQFLSSLSNRDKMLSRTAYFVVQKSLDDFINNYEERSLQLKSLNRKEKNQASWK